MLPQSIDIEPPQLTAQQPWRRLFVSTTSGALSQNTTIASASNGAALPQSTINVASTTGFPSSGTILITISGTPTVVTYTGTTSTSFTGCSGGSGTLATGDAVASPFNGAYGWQEQRQTISGNGTWENNTDGMSGTQTNCPLYMIDGGTTVTSGTLCEAVVYFPGNYLLGWPAKSSSSSGGSGVVQCQVTVFTTSGTFTPNAATQWFDVEVVGGGGAGGGGVNLGSGFNNNGSIAAGGGGSGGYARLTVNAPLAASYSVTVGAGGTASSGGNGGSGGTSSFTGTGVNVQATGGSGGNVSEPYNTNPPSWVSDGGVGGAGSGGNLNLTGNTGSPGIAGVTVTAGTVCYGGMGAPSIFGGAGYVHLASGSNQSPSYGGGGAGYVIASGAPTDTSGQAGGGGIVIVREYQS